MAQPRDRQPQSGIDRLGLLAVGVAFIGLLVASGARQAYTAVLQPLQAAFGTDRSTASSVASVGLLAFAFFQPFAGVMIDRWGERRTFAAGLVVCGLSLAALSRAPSLPLVFAFFTIASLGFAMAGQVTATTVVTRRFQRRQGLLLGFVQAGTSTGRTLLVPLAVLLVTVIGWRGWFLTVGLFALLVMAPLVLAGVGRPAGGTEHPQQATAATRRGWPSWASSWSFWGLTLAYFVCGYTTTGLVATHLVPLALGEGFARATVATAAGVLGVCDIAGTMFSGYLTDLFDRRRLLSVYYLYRALTLFALLFARSPLMLIVFAAAFGLVDLATVPPTASLAVQVGGRGTAGRVYSWVYLAHQFGGALGAFVPALLFDRTGSYQPAVLMAIAMLLGASACTFTLPEPVPRTAEAAAR